MDKIGQRTGGVVEMVKRTGWKILDEKEYAKRMGMM